MRCELQHSSSEPGTRALGLSREPEAENPTPAARILCLVVGWVGMGKGLELDKPNTVQFGGPIKCFIAWSLCSMCIKNWRLPAFNLMPVFLLIKLFD